MVLYTGGPYIPGLPPEKATPAKPTSSKSTSVGETNRFANLLSNVRKSAAAEAAAKQPAVKPAPVTERGVYIPAGAYRKDGSAVSPASIAMAEKINQAIVPKKSTLGTGSIETKTAPTPKTDSGSTTGGGTTGGGTTGGGTTESAAEKPIQVVLDQEEMDAAQQAADALRTFQENQAKMQLQQVLGKIDRAAIEQYKGISEDYAARGLARSGGKLQTEQKAIDERDRAVGEATQAVTDFLNELKLTGNLEQASTNLGKSQAFQDYISGRLGPAMGA